MQYAYYFQVLKMLNFSILKTNGVTREALLNNYNASIKWSKNEPLQCLYYRMLVPMTDFYQVMR